MKRFTIFLTAMFLVIIAGFSQVAINKDGSSPDASAILDVKSTDKGVLVPRMILSESESISNPANGLIVFNNTDNKFYAFVSVDNEWKEILYGTGTITPTWSCGDALVDVRDSQSYTTIQIGTQCWMAENLNIGTMINSTSGGTNSDGEQTNNSIIEKYCYDNNTTNCDTYGGLYQWDEMMQYVSTEGTQGICPTGWHLPTDAEWCTLENYVDAGTVSCSATGWRGTDAGGNLKETGITHWSSPNTGATNSSGFTVLPGGYTFPNGSFENLTNYAYFWSSSVSGPSAWSRGLDYNLAQVYRHDNNQAYGWGVRCVLN